MKYATMLFLICSLAHAEWGESPGRGCIHPKPRWENVEHAVVVELQEAPVCKQCLATPAIAPVAHAEVVDLDTKAFMREHGLTVPPIMLDTDGQEIKKAVAHSETVVKQAPALLPSEMPIFSAYEKEPAPILPDIAASNIFPHPVAAEILDTPDPNHPTAEQIEAMRRQMFPPIRQPEKVLVSPLVLVSH